MPSLKIDDLSPITRSVPHHPLDMFLERDPIDRATRESELVVAVCTFDDREGGCSCGRDDQCPPNARFGCTHADERVGRKLAFGRQPQARNVRPRRAFSEARHSSARA